MTKLIRITEETYAELSTLAGKLQARLKRMVSLDDAVQYLLSVKNHETREYWRKLKNKRR